MSRFGMKIVHGIGVSQSTQDSNGLAVKLNYSSINGYFGRINYSRQYRVTASNYGGVPVKTLYN